MFNLIKGNNVGSLQMGNGRNPRGMWSWSGDESGRNMVGVSAFGINNRFKHGHRARCVT